MSKENIQTNQLDGDVAVGRDVAVGGSATIQGRALIKGSVKIEGWLDAKNIKGANKGIFLSVAKLKEAYPLPHDGWWAIVGNTLPGPLYIAHGGEWVATGSKAGSVTIDSEQYNEAVAQLQTDVKKINQEVGTIKIKDTEQDGSIAVLNTLIPALQEETQEAASNAISAIDKSNVVSNRLEVLEKSKGQPQGIAPLNEQGEIDVQYLPEAVIDKEVIYFAESYSDILVQNAFLGKSSSDKSCRIVYAKNVNAFAIEYAGNYYMDWIDGKNWGEKSGKGRLPFVNRVYIDCDKNITYRANTENILVPIGSYLRLGNDSTSAFPGDKGNSLRISLDALKTKVANNADEANARLRTRAIFNANELLQTGDKVSFYEVIKQIDASKEKEEVQIPGVILYFLNKGGEWEARQWKGMSEWLDIKDWTRLGVTTNKQLAPMPNDTIKGYIDGKEDTSTPEDIPFETFKKKLALGVQVSGNANNGYILSQGGNNIGTIAFPKQFENSGFEVVNRLPTTNLFAGREVFYNGQKYVYNGSIWINVNAPYEANLQWGGGNFAEGYSPIDAALVPALGANRIAFLPPENINVEYSRDGGATWLDYDNANIDRFKRSLTSDSNAHIYIGNYVKDNTQPTADYQLRVTINAGTQVYSRIRKLAVYYSVNGSQNAILTVSASKTGSDDYIELTNSKLQAFPGYSVLNFDAIIFGNRTNQYDRLRLTFTASGSDAVNGVVLVGLGLYGGVGWFAPSNLAKIGTIYSFDEYGNVTFPSAVKSNETVNFDANIKPTQTGTVTKTSNWLWQYYAQSIAWLMANHLPLAGGTMTGNLTVPKLIKSGGTANQLLLADGSTKDVDDFAKNTEAGGINQSTISEWWKDGTTVYKADLFTSVSLFKTDLTEQKFGDMTSASWKGNSMTIDLLPVNIEDANAEWDIFKNNMRSCFPDSMQANVAFFSNLKLSNNKIICSVEMRYDDSGAICKVFLSRAE